MRLLSPHPAAMTSTLAALMIVLGPSVAHGQSASQTLGALAQLSGTNGCLVDRSSTRDDCAPTRALLGPGPFLGSRAVAISPDGRQVYVASSTSDAVAILRRNARTGVLTQASGKAGCIAEKGAQGCAWARGLNGPNSVAVSPGGRNVYVTSRNSDDVSVLRRNPSTGALTQLSGAAGCISGIAAVPGCAAGRALDGPDVVAVSPDGRNVYVGSFFGNAVVTFTRDASTGALAQPGDATGCLATATAGCATGIALGAPEGMAVSADGASVYVATAASNAVLTLARNASTGALTQATDGTGCIANAVVTGCTTGVTLAGANALAVSPGDDDVYATSLVSNSVTSFTRTAGSGLLAQQQGTSACAIYLLAVGCSLARSLSAPEGVAVSPDGASVYAAAYNSGTIATFVRSTTGALKQQSGRLGCVTGKDEPDCATGRALSGVSSIAVSPDGRHVYAAAFKSNALTVFARTTTTRTPE